MRIALVNPGEMGAAIGAQLVRAGHQVRWLPAGRSQSTYRRAESAGLEPADSVQDCDVVLSVGPPAAAEDIARSVAGSEVGFTGLYVDLNAISPQTAESVQRITEQGGARAVDGSVIGPPPSRPGTTRIFLSSDGAADAAQLFRDTVIEPVILDQSRTAASAIKVAYGSWTKGSAALLLAAHATAEHHGVDAALLDEWNRSQPALAQRLQAAQSEATNKGWRWAAEMQENARTFEAAGQPPGFAEAAAEIFDRYPRPNPG